MVDFIQGCKNGAHVENCGEVICGKKFKCEKSYCIPWQFVCSGEWDCPDGCDENSDHVCNEGQCVGMYLCKNRVLMCVPLSTICDSVTDCPSGDDEILCDLSSIDCPSHCHCLVYGLQCKNVSFTFKNMVSMPFHFLAVFEGCVKDLKFMNDVFGDTVHIIIQKSQIAYICGSFTFESMSDVLTIDFSKNIISILGRFCFNRHQNVVDIDLSENALENIKVFFFAQLLSLTKLDLSRNPLQYLSPHFLTNATNFVVLNLSENHFHFFGSATFKVLDVKLIITENFKICCVTHKNSKCEAQLPWFMSCSDLLPMKYIKMLFYVISVVVILLNAFSFWLTF